SRTSLRGVATLYQGSIPLPLRSLQSSEQGGGAALQPRQVRVRDRLEPSVACIHAISNSIGNDYIPRHFQCLDVALRLFQCTLDPRTQALGLDHYVTVLRRARKGAEHRHVNAPPLHGDSLGRPAERPQERYDEVSDQLIFARRFPETLGILIQRHKVGRLCDNPGKRARHLFQRRLFHWQLGEWRRLPVRWRRVQEPLRKIHRFALENPRTARWTAAENRRAKRMLLRKLAPSHPTSVLKVPSVHIIELFEVEILACD